MSVIRILIFFVNDVTELINNLNIEASNPNDNVNIASIPNENVNNFLQLPQNPGLNRLNPNIFTTTFFVRTTPRND